MPWPKLLRFLGVALFLCSGLAGLYLAISIAGARLGGVFNTVVSDSPSNQFKSLQCPLLLNKNETASVAAVILNPARDPLRYSVRIEPGRFSIGSAEQELSVTIPGGQTGKVSWSVTAVEKGAHALAIQAVSNADAALPGLFHMWPTSFREGCGILVVGGPLNGWLILVLDLAGLLAGGAITFQWLYSSVRRRLAARRRIS